jgi:hypothetical protein
LPNNKKASEVEAAKRHTILTRHCHLGTTVNTLAFVHGRARGLHNQTLPTGVHQARWLLHTDPIRDLGTSLELMSTTDGAHHLSLVTHRLLEQNEKPERVPLLRIDANNSYTPGLARPIPSDTYSHLLLPHDKSNEQLLGAFKTLAQFRSVESDVRELLPLLLHALFFR